MYRDILIEITILCVISYLHNIPGNLMKYIWNFDHKLYTNAIKLRQQQKNPSSENSVQFIVRIISLPFASFSTYFSNHPQSSDVYSMYIYKKNT